MGTPLFGRLFFENTTTPVPNSTFRLHLGEGVYGGNVPGDERKFDGIISFELGSTKRQKNVTLKLEEKPEPQVIYEREIHLTISHPSLGNRKFDLKEGTRFMRAAFEQDDFPVKLVHFIGMAIPDLVAYVK